MRKFFPLGPACFTNIKLLKIPQLIKYRINHSPFNGCRILNSFNSYFPQREFLFNRDDFYHRYYNKDNWEIAAVGQDIQATNKIVNLRRCHLPKEGIEKFLSIVKNVTPEKLNNNDVCYIINMNDDIKGYYDFKKLQHECKDNNINIIFLYPEKYKEYVDTKIEKTYNITEFGCQRFEELDIFYSKKCDELLQYLQ